MENKLEAVQELVNGLDSNEISLINDKFHSFEELYDFRKVYNALLFNEWGKQIDVKYHFVKNQHGLLKQEVLYKKFKYDVHKSIRHNDGELCFGGGWFVVVAMLPSGQITNHYKIEDWGLFQIPEEERAKYEFDNHTSHDVLERMLNVIKG